jgi:hypothetical protein
MMPAVNNLGDGIWKLHLLAGLALQLILPKSGAMSLLCTLLNQLPMYHLRRLLALKLERVKLIPI